MGHDYLKIPMLLILVIPSCFIPRIGADIDEESWLDPDAWTRDHLISAATDNVFCKCSENSLKRQQLTNMEDLASLMYLKKFITMLFNRKNFKYDSSQKIYERAIIFTIQSHQMDKLEQLQDPRDLDTILVDVFNNVRTPNIYRDGQQHASETSNAFKSIVLNLFYDFLQLTKTSEIRFLLVVAILVAIAWIFNTRFHIGWMPLVFGGIFIYGYLYTYLECNREMEANQLLEILSLHENSNTAEKTSNFFNFVKGIFHTNDVLNLQKQKIKHSAKLSLGFCRPDHVLIIYFNDVFLKYLEVLLEQCTHTLTSLNSVLGFPYNIFSGFLLVSMIAYITKLTFKYIISPSAWAQYTHRKQLYQSEHVTIKRKKNSEDDRISGDNLKLLLHAINATPQQQIFAPKQSTAINVSGVEEIKDEEPLKETNSTSGAGSKNDNNQLNCKLLDGTTDVNVEDVVEDL